MGFTEQSVCLQKQTTALLCFATEIGILFPLLHGGGVIQPLACKRTGAGRTVPRTVVQCGWEHDGDIDVAGEPHQIHVIDHRIAEVVADKAQLLFAPVLECQLGNVFQIEEIANRAADGIQMHSECQFFALV